MLVRDSVEERFWLSSDEAQEHAERDWTMRSLESGEVIATFEVPLCGVPYVRPSAGDTYRVEPYGHGWRLAARATWDEQTLLWYTGRWVRSGGLLQVAPDRRYDVRSKWHKRLDLYVREDGRRLLEANAVPRGDEGADVTISLLARPAVETDTGLLVTFVGLREILVFRTGRRLSGLRAPA